MTPKIFIGPVSKNVIDATIEIAEFLQYPLALIPSRRQIDYIPFLGYVSQFDTKYFIQYVQSRSNYVQVERDHAGPLQGRIRDAGLESIIYDCNSNIDLIHIDPWKLDTYDEAFEYTAKLIKHAHITNSSVEFEIGTEEAIKPLDTNTLEDFIIYLKKELSIEEFSKIKYLVIQSGTKLDLIKKRNVGKFSLNRLKKMISLSDSYNLLSKEHNGDYLSSREVKLRFESGLGGINIAPELGQIESECLAKEMNKEQRKQFFNVVYNNPSWIKWVDSLYFPSNNKNQFIKSFGHYIFSKPEFQAIKCKLNPTIDDYIKIKIKNRIYELIKSAEGNNI